MGGRRRFSGRVGSLFARVEGCVARVGAKVSRLRLSPRLTAVSTGFLAAFLVFIPLSAMSGGAASLRSSWPRAINAHWDAKPRANVAHALGEIDGIFYTNSREAFLFNYEKGFRTFEVDLMPLQDGSVFCAHDGLEWMYGLEKHFTQTTSDELSGRLCLGKYTPLTGSTLIDLINDYSDTIFLLDIKERSFQGSNHAVLEAVVAEANERCPSILDRMIPRIVGPADLREVADIHHFRDYWVAVFSLRCNVDRTSSAEPDRVIVYITSRGKSLILLQMRHNRLADFASHIADAFGLLPTPYNARVYVSVDIMGTDPEPGLL